MKKKIIIAVVIIIVLIVAAAALLLSGFFVTPRNFDELTEVPHFDILEFQWERELAIAAEFEQYDYTFENPFIVVDPYSLNPLSALILFSTETAGDVEVTILGDDEFSTISYIHRIVPPRAEIPIIGLYAGRTNTVTLTIGSLSHDFGITTEPLPVDFPDIVLHTSDPQRMAPGLTLLTSIFESYSPLIDHNAQVRGFLSNKSIGHGTSMILLENGNMMSTGAEFMMIPYHKSYLIEFNWLGKIFRVIEVPNGIHHSIYEMPSGDILASSNNINMYESGTREDVVIIIDRVTGEVTSTFDFRLIVDETRSPHHHFDPGVVGAPIRDWMHVNAAVFDPAHNAVLVSSPIQSNVISVDADTQAINWILGPHYNYREDLQQYLLTPIGEDFIWSWAQHDPRILESSDPNIVNLILFDNGANRSFYKESSIPAVENFSRAVKYEINIADMTVRQLWDFGEQLGSAYYSTYLGNAVLLHNPSIDKSTVLINFGGMLRQDGVPIDDLIQSVMGNTVTNSAIMEVTLDGEIIFEISLHENDFTMAAGTYMATRIPLFMPESFSTLLGQAKGERVGTPPSARIPDDVTIPPIHFGAMTAELNNLHRTGNRLILDGVLYNGGQTRLLSQVMIVLRGSEGAYVFAANSGLNGRFFLSVDLNLLSPGQYRIEFIGATVEGNDAQGRRTIGHFATDNKITVK